MTSNPFSPPKKKSSKSLREQLERDAYRDIHGHRPKNPKKRILKE